MVWVFRSDWPDGQGWEKETESGDAVLQGEGTALAGGIAQGGVVGGKARHQAEDAIVRPHAAPAAQRNAGAVVTGIGEAAQG